MKNRWVLGVTFLALSISTVAVNAQVQTRERVVRRLPVEQNEPIGLTQVKVNGERVFAKKAFLAGDEWLKGLVISIKNRSDKLILFASIQLQFPRPNGSEDPIAMDEMFFGNLSLRTRPPTPDERLTGIAPGETVGIRLSEQQYVDLTQLLIMTNYSSSIEKVDLRINSVIFDDDTMWTRGAITRRDPNKPSAWINVSP